jgi:hypothetical protein
VTVRRGWLIGGKLRVKIDGRPALEIVSSRGAIAVRSIAGEAIEARGDVRSGSYEIRRGGRLVGLCFRDQPHGASGPEVRRIEVLREEDPVLPLALAVGVEVAATMVRAAP